jgi:hypothetical protein
MLAACAGILAWLFAGNPRLLGSWHGFLHSGIAGSFAHAFPPENPFFAGEPLPYYWFYHLAGYWLSTTLRLNLLLTFQLISWASMAVLVTVSGLIGRRLWRSSAAGVAIACLALCGLNPLGPAIAVARNVARGEVLVEQATEPVETMFVSNVQADRLMTQPLLGAMYVGSDWRQGMNLVWFFDIGSRAPALAGLMLLLYLLLQPGPTVGRVAVIAAVSAVVTALNPLIGLAVAGALGLASLIRRQWPVFLLSAACGLGALLAAPTYYQMFFRVSGGSGLGLRTAMGPVIVVVNSVALAAFAAMGARNTKNPQLTTLALAGTILLVMLAVIHLPEGNEHNLGNAAQCLLAVPAGALTVYLSRTRAVLMLAMFVPVTAATLFAYADRPAMPVAFAASHLSRTPADDLQRFYDWVRRATPPQSIFIVDPAAAVKMSGNASEFPAMTARMLFTDLPNYLTTPNRDAALRAQLAGDATQARELTQLQRDYLLRLARPIYVVAYRSASLDRLTSLYGPALIQNEAVAVFEFVDTKARRQG